jgi:hypothetical protein
LRKTVRCLIHLINFLKVRDPGRRHIITVFVVGTSRFWLSIWFQLARRCSFFLFFRRYCRIYIRKFITSSSTYLSHFNFIHNYYSTNCSTIILIHNLGVCTIGQKWPQYQGLSPTPPIKKYICTLMYSSFIFQGKMVKKRTLSKISNLSNLKKSYKDLHLY